MIGVTSHRDVSFLQGSKKNLIGGFLSKIDASRLEKISNAVAGCSSAVSYTHLDVYKRQLQKDRLGPSSGLAQARHRG